MGYGRSRMSRRAFAIAGRRMRQAFAESPTCCYLVKRSYEHPATPPVSECGRPATSGPPWRCVEHTDPPKGA